MTLPLEEEESNDMVNLITFDGDKHSSTTWSLTNDPVMGGQSKSTFTISDTKTAIFDGHCAIVPKLKAPGFCNAKSKLMDGLHFRKLPDISAFSHLVLKVRSSTPEYKGFKVSLAADTWNPQFDSYKANFMVPAGDDFQLVAIPWEKFSNDWSAYTGDCDTTDPRGKVHHCCDKDHPDVCISKKNLSDINQVGLWAEGHEGQFHLEIESISGGNISTDDNGEITVVSM